MSYGATQTPEKREEGIVRDSVGMSMYDPNAEVSRSSRARRSFAYTLIPGTAFIAGLVGAVAVACWKSEPFTGVYRQEVVPVLSPASGRIVSLNCERGLEVKPGDPLITVENGDAAARLTTLCTQQESLRRELDDARAKAALELALRSDSIEKERLETQLRYADLMRTRLDVQLRRKALEGSDVNGNTIAAASADVITLTSVVPRTTMRQLELADVANHEEVLNTQIALCEDRIAELDRSKSSLPLSIERSFRITSLQEELAAVTAQCGDLERESKTYEVESPAFGRVGIHRREVGEFASAGETLVEVFDAERPYVLLTVSVSEMANLPEGQRVRVSFDGIKTRKPLEGVVAEVLSEAERDADIAAGPGATFAQVQIRPVGHLWPTPPAGATAFVEPLD